MENNTQLITQYEVPIDPAEFLEDSTSCCQ